MKSAVVAQLAVFAVTLAVEVTLNTKFIVGTSCMFVFDAVVGHVLWAVRVLAVVWVGVCV